MDSKALAASATRQLLRWGPVVGVLVYGLYFTSPKPQLKDLLRVL